MRGKRIYSFSYRDGTGLRSILHKGSVGSHPQCRPVHFNWRHVMLYCQIRIKSLDRIENLIFTCKIRAEKFYDIDGIVRICSKGRCRNRSWLIADVMDLSFINNILAYQQTYIPIWMYYLKILLAVFYPAYQSAYPLSDWFGILRHMIKNRSFERGIITSFQLGYLLFLLKKYGFIFTVEIV